MREWQVVQRLAGVVMFAALHAQRVPSQRRNVTVVKRHCVTALVLWNSFNIFY